MSISNPEFEAGDKTDGIIGGISVAVWGPQNANVLVEKHLVGGFAVGNIRARASPTKVDESFFATVADSCMSQFLS